MTSNRLPRGLDQREVLRALVRAGGVIDKTAGKGSHVRVTMPNGVKVFIPKGGVKTGTLAAIIKQSGLSRDEFITLL